MSFFTRHVARSALRSRTPLAAGRLLATSAELKPCKDFTAVTHPDTEAPQSTHDLIAEHTKYVLNTYARPPLLFTHGKGCKLYDSSDRQYLDFTAGIAVNALGHADAEVANIMHEAASKLSHVSNVYWNEWAGELAKGLVENTREHGGLGLSKTSQEGGKVFFSNSGTEANEGALKFARAMGKLTSENKTGIVCFQNAFHGRSMGALSVTPNPKYQGPFAPLIPDVRVGKLNDLEGVEALIDESVCGVILEPIQGEGGVTAAHTEWVTKVVKRAREVGAIVIFDEIQCGLFRSGTMWAHSDFPAEAQPDIVTMAKPLANGFPIGAIMVRDNVANAITPGMHGTTFGGQPLATRLGAHVLSRLSEPSFVAQIRSTAAHLDTLIQRLPALFPSILTPELRGRGLIRGIAFKDATAPGQLVKLARERGVLLLTAGSDAVRMVPSLNVTTEECDHALKVVESCLAVMESEGWGTK